MKSLIINKNDLRHNINVIKDIAKIDIPDDDGATYNSNTHILLHLPEYRD